MKIDVVKLIVGAMAGSIIYKIGKRDGYNEHVDKVRDVLLDKFVDQQTEEES